MVPLCIFRVPTSFTTKCNVTKQENDHLGLYIMYVLLNTAQFWTHQNVVKVGQLQTETQNGLIKAILLFQRLWIFFANVLPEFRVVPSPLPLMHAAQPMHTQIFVAKLLIKRRFGFCMLASTFACFPSIAWATIQFLFGPSHANRLLICVSAHRPLGLIL